MGRNADEGPWGLGGRVCATALQVAGKLMDRETISDLRYREVCLQAKVVDVSPCQDSLGSSFYRYFVLRPTSWPAQPLPGGNPVPAEWRSEVLTLPRKEGDGLMTRLAPFEAVFAVRSFLLGVEREIDGVLKRAHHRKGSPAQR